MLNVVLVAARLRLEQPAGHPVALRGRIGTTSRIQNHRRLAWREAGTRHRTSLRRAVRLLLTLGWLTVVRARCSITGITVSRPGRDRLRAKSSNP